MKALSQSNDLFRTGLLGHLLPAISILLVMLTACLGGDDYESNIIALEQWQDPPAEARPYTRWWWPGGAVEEGVIRREMQRFNQTGFGGVEIQPFAIGLSREEASSNPDIRTVGEPGFFALLAAAADEAASLGLGFDVTLGSGWPNGSPSTGGATERQLLLSHRDVTGPQQFYGKVPVAEPPDYIPLVDFAYDTLGPFDEALTLVKVVGAKVINSSSNPVELDSFLDLSGFCHDSILAWDVPAGTWRVFGLYENTTSHKVFGGAYPGEDVDALVVDHLNRRGAETVINGYGTQLTASVSPPLIDTVFIDSFEPIGELPWTSDFLARFEAHKGYDLTPYLPLVFINGGEAKAADVQDNLFGRSDGPLYSAGGTGERVREDYEDVRAALFEEAFIAPVLSWAHENGLKLRLQAHGGLMDYLDGYELADIPETEGFFAAGNYDFLKLASSAGHTGGKKTISSESFVSLSLFRTTLSVIEMQLLAGRALSAGINRVIHHGIPYPYEREDGTDWYPFPGFFGQGDLLLAGILPIMNWTGGYSSWGQLTEFNDYVGRLSYAMAMGDHVSDIAWLKAEPVCEDYAAPLLFNVVPREYESEVTAALKGSGHTYDRISRKGLTKAQITDRGFRVGAASYRALLINDLPVAEPEMLATVVAMADSGVPVLVLGALPFRAPGLSQASVRDELIREAAVLLSSSAILIDSPGEIGHTLIDRGVLPALAPAANEPMGFAIDHRVTNDGHIFLLFNESYLIASQRLRTNVTGKKIGKWDAQAGKATTLVTDLTRDSVFEVSLWPAEAVVITVE